jgi:hypothetical protein
MNRSFLRDNTAFAIPLGGSAVPLHHIDSFNDQTIPAGIDVKDLGYFSAAIAADDKNAVAFFYIHRIILRPLLAPETQSS